MAVFVVTGGAGFIGSHLADALLGAGHAVRVFDDFSTGRAGNLPRGCEVVTGDVADPNAVRAVMAGADGCFHLAAIASVVRSLEDWVGTHRVNQGGTVAVLDAARCCGRIPVVYASSAAVYGDVGDRPAQEDMLPAPNTAYGADKLGSELQARAGFVSQGVPSLGLRFFNVYGPRQDPASPYSGVISIFARRIADGTPVTIHGDGSQTRDFVFVSDVVSHLLAGMQRLAARAPGSGAEVVNVCRGRTVSIRALAGHIGVLLGKAPNLLAGAARHGDIRHSVGDPTRASAALGVRAEISLDEGLAALLAWQAHGNQARPT